MAGGRQSGRVAPVSLTEVLVALAIAVASSASSSPCCPGRSWCSGGPGLGAQRLDDDRVGRVLPVHRPAGRRRRGEGPRPRPPAQGLRRPHTARSRSVRCWGSSGSSWSPSWACSSGSCWASTSPSAPGWGARPPAVHDGRAQGGGRVDPHRAGRGVPRRRHLGRRRRRDPDVGVRSHAGSDPEARGHRQAPAVALGCPVHDRVRPVRLVDHLHRDPHDDGSPRHSRAMTARKTSLPHFGRAE